MNKYGSAAVKAAKLCRSENITPNSAWKRAICELTQSPSAQEKGCPKNAFLGLCSEGLVKGVSKGTYTKSIANKQYAVDSYHLLQKNPELMQDKWTLWQSVNHQNIAHNSQMDVVIALFENGLM